MALIHKFLKDTIQPKTTNRSVNNNLKVKNDVIKNMEANNKKKLKEFKVPVSAEWVSDAYKTEGNYFCVMNLTEPVFLKSTYLNTIKINKLECFSIKIIMKM